MIDLSAFSANPKVRIYGKCEYLNPSGSIKDRIAQEIWEPSVGDGRAQGGYDGGGGDEWEHGCGDRDGVRDSWVSVHRHHESEDE